MGFGALLGLESGISYTATGRDDHPGQALIFEAHATFCALCIECIAVYINHIMSRSPKHLLGSNYVQTQLAALLGGIWELSSFRSVSSKWEIF